MKVNQSRARIAEHVRHVAEVCAASPCRNIFARDAGSETSPAARRPRGAGTARATPARIEHPTGVIVSALAGIRHRHRVCRVQRLRGAFDAIGAGSASQARHRQRLLAAATSRRARAG
jgi:hypothetical protein